MKRVYLDVCALCRPFDDQSQARIRAESTSIDLILNAARRKKFELVVSSAHDAEVKAIRDAEERYQLNMRLAMLGSRVEFDRHAAQRRADELILKGFGIADAAHVAIAEQVGADFVSVDDRLLRKCMRHAMKVWCGTPLAFCDREGLR